MRASIYLFLVLASCLPVESYDLSTWRNWQPILSKYFGAKYDNFYKFGGSFPGPQQLQIMIKEDIEKLTRNNPMKGLDFYQEADQVARRTGIQMVDLKTIQSRINQNMKAGVSKALSQVSPEAQNRMNQILNKYPANSQTRNLVNSAVQKEVDKIRGQLLSDFGQLDNLSPQELKHKVMQMCSLANKFPTENEFAEICQKSKSLTQAQNRSDLSKRAQNSEFGKDIEKNISETVNQAVEAEMIAQKQKWFNEMQPQMSALKDIDPEKSLDISRQIQQKFSNDTKIKGMAQQISNGIEKGLESKMHSYSQLNLGKIEPLPLLYLNKDACQMMEMRPGDQLSTKLCIESNREISIRKRQNFREWVRIVQQFKQEKEDNFRKKLKELGIDNSKN